MIAKIRTAISDKAWEGIVDTIQLIAILAFVYMLVRYGCRS